MLGSCMLLPSQRSRSMPRKCRCCRCTDGLSWCCCWAPQAEWTWALHEVEEGYSHVARMSRLELATPGGATRLVAHNALLFRVDSLEDTPVGQALLIRNWQLLS